MLCNSKIVLVAVFIMGATSAGMAESVRLPTLDLHKLCEQNDAAVRAVLSDIRQDLVSVCITDEQAAREQIVKEWSSFPPKVRSLCLQPKEFLPGYSEWLSCLQMSRDVLQQRKDQAATPATSVADRPARRQCPVVQIAADGSITSVTACQIVQ